jgi:hypothetical protein
LFREGYARVVADARSVGPAAIGRRPERTRVATNALGKYLDDEVAHAALAGFDG